MKSIWKKMTALLLAGLLAAAAVPAVSAEETDGLCGFPKERAEVVRGGDEESGYVLRRTVEEQGSFPGRTMAGTYAAPANAEQYDNGSMYSQLTARQKSCYNALEGITIDRILKASETGGYKTVTVRVDEFYGTLLAGKVVNGQFTAAATSKSLETAIYTDMCLAITAIRYDRPDLMWVSDMQYGYNWQQQANGSVKVTDMLFGFKLLYDGQEKKLWESMLGEAQKIAGQIDRTADTYTQLQEVHDILVERNTYNDKPAGGMDENLSHAAYSGLIGGDAYEPVCDGYSKAFMVVCGYLEIPCVLATSATHMWNNVKMDDGDWYNVDLTWDDTSDEELSYDYFLIGSQTTIEDEVFSKQPDHVEENPFQEAGLSAVLRFPVKNKAAYEYLGQEYEPLQYPDVKRSAWYYQYIDAASSMGLFKGNKDGMFQPGNKITRAEFVQVMANASGADLSVYKESPFTDVSVGQWYLPAVAWAKETGLMQGYKNGTFRPNAPISREEMCVVLYNANKTHTEPSDFRFPDDNKISSWAKAAVYECYALSLVQGDTSGNFAPKANTLRSEAATVFTRYMGQGTVQ